MSYYLLVKAIAAVHLVWIAVNLAAVPAMIVLAPWYIWAPLITFLVSPHVGGVYCMMNRLENHFREKANMPLIKDRVSAFLGMEK